MSYSLFNNYTRGYRVLLLKMLRGVSVLGKQFDLTLTYIYITLGFYDWWMAPFLLQLTPQHIAYYYKRIKDKPQNVGKKYVDHLVVLYYRHKNYKTLDKIVNKWSGTYFKKRKDIFKEALWAHKRGKFTLSTLALVPQIEGILREYFENTKPGGSWQNDFKEKYSVKSDINTDFHELNNPNLPLQKQLSLSKQLRITLNLKRITDLFTSGNFNDPQFINGYKRHPMLHGLCIKYNEVNSLKTFLLIDLIHDVITENHLC